MVPALAFFLAARVVVEGRREAILSFDVAAARKAFPYEGATAVDAAAWQTWVRTVAGRALARYPAVDLVARLDRAYVVQLLWYDKTYLGGLNDPEGRRVIVALGPGTVTNDWLERCVHHEFAHALKDGRAWDFPAKAWRAANAPGFVYGKGGYAAMTAGRSKEAYDGALAEQGVLSEYGASSIDEDWATIVESMMVDDAAFWALVDRYPRLRAKTRLAVEFYRRTFPGIRLRESGPAKG